MQNKKDEGQESKKKEDTPKTNPKNFENVKGSKAKKNKRTGEIWEKDLFHRDHYEVYKDKKSWEKGKRDRDVYEDGRSKGTF